MDKLIEAVAVFQKESVNEQHTGNGVLLIAYKNADETGCQVCSGLQGDSNKLEQVLVAQMLKSDDFANLIVHCTEKFLDAIEALPEIPEDDCDASHCGQDSIEPVQTMHIKQKGEAGAE